MLRLHNYSKAILSKLELARIWMLDNVNKLQNVDIFVYIKMSNQVAYIIS